MLTIGCLYKSHDWKFFCISLLASDNNKLQNGAMRNFVNRHISATVFYQVFSLQIASCILISFGKRVPSQIVSHQHTV